MTIKPPPSGSSSSAPAGPPVDGVSAPHADVKPLVTPVAPEVNRMKRALLIFGGVIYTAYALWCVGLLALLPSAEAWSKQLTSVGLLSSLIAGVFFLGIGWFMLQRIAGSQVSIAQRRVSLLKAAAILIPGVLLSAAVPLMITREPSFTVDITDPVAAADFVAPLPVTLSVERAADGLKKLGFRPVQYQWDTDGDGKMNEETVLPMITVLYERQGVYTAVVRINFDDGSVRRLTRRIVIPQAVFSVAPPKPILEKAVRFSISHMVTDPKMLKEVEWNFGDGTAPEIAKGVDVVHTYYSIGSYQVSAVVRLQNQSQVTYKRAVEVGNEPPLPFPVTLTAEPSLLVGPAPLGAIFRVETQEPVKEVHWDFGDGKEERGKDLIRVGHSFEKEGIFPVVVRVRSASGQLAELSTLVRVTPALSLQNLRFEAQPPVQNAKIKGEVPLTLTITPRTATPLVQFSWEAPTASSSEVSGDTLKAVYRKQGSYTIVLVAQDPEGKVMRMPLTVDVQPPSAEASILMTPDGGVAPLTVVFDASQTFIPPGETLAGFQWSFGDKGNGTEPGGARVEHLYKNPGEYPVTLRVIMASGKEFTAERTLVVRRPSLNSCITASRLSVEAGKGISFDSSCSTGIPSSILWDVRLDANPGIIQGQSPAAQYIHVFPSSGTYTVTLTLKDQWGGQDTSSVSITVLP